MSGSSGSGGVGGGGKVVNFNPGQIAQDNNEKAIKEAFDADAPIIVPLGAKIPGKSSTKSSKSSEGGAAAGGTGGTGGPGGGMPTPPSPDGSPGGTEGFASAMNYFSSIGGGDGAASVFAFMVQFQKMLNKEARSAKHQSVVDARLENKFKDAKIDMQITKIGEMKVEAGERYEHAMNAAMWEMGLGIASGVAAALSVCGSFGAEGGNIAGVAGTFKGVMTAIGIAGKIADAGVKLVQGGAAMHIASEKNFADFQKAQGMKSDETEILIDQQDKAINKKTEEATESKADSDDAHDRKKAGLDNLQKILDILHGMPNVNA